jgi:hypothetical protein
VRSHSLGIVVEEMDFRLETDTVRNPDVAFITADYLRNIDPYASPVEGRTRFGHRSHLAKQSCPGYGQKSPAVSCGRMPGGLAGLSRVAAVEIHNATGARRISEPESIRESKLLSGFTFLPSLTALFDDVFRQ